MIGLDQSFDMAFAKSQLGGGTKVPVKGAIFVSVRDVDKARILESVRMLTELGFTVRATGGTCRYFEQNGVSAQKINKVSEGRPHIVDAIANGAIQLVLQHDGGNPGADRFALAPPRGPLA